MKKALGMVVIVGLIFAYYSGIAEAAILLSDSFTIASNPISGWNETGSSGTYDVYSGTIPSGNGPAGNYAILKENKSKDATAYMAQTISTSTYNNIQLNYYRRNVGGSGGVDTILKVEWMPNLGSWTALENYTTAETSWLQKNWNLSSLNSAANNSNVSIRFSLTHTDNGVHDAYGLIDEVLLTGDVIPEPASLSLLGLGLLGLVGLKRKKS